MDGLRNPQIPYVAPKRKPGPPKPPRPPRGPHIGAGTAAPAEDPVMTLFRTTLGEINKAASPVDAATIRAPYDQGGVLAGQIASGAALADQASSARASDQYAKITREANDATAGAGAAIGAPASAPQQDETQGRLALQNQAQQQAAIGAGTAWQNLLNRVATAAVGKATLDRQGRIDAASESLAASLPGQYQARDDLAFKKQANTDQMDYLRHTLSQKEQDALRADETRRRGQDVTARGQDIVSSTADANRAAAATRQEKHDQATIKGAWKRAQLVGTRTKNTQGLAQIVKLLTPKPGVDSTEPAGWDVQVQKVTGTQQPYGDVQTLYGIADARPERIGQVGGVPTGYRIVSSKPATRKVKGVGLGVTLPMWNAAVGAAMVARGIDRPAAEKLVASISPKPPK